MRLYISNAFSLSMLDREAQTASGRNTRFPYPIDDPREFLSIQENHGVKITSVVGHADTARVFTEILGRNIEQNRETVKLEDDEILLIGQYIGPRLPEGATELPENARIEWWTI